MTPRRIERYAFIVMALAVSAVCLTAQQPEALWYATSRDASTQAFLTHTNKISVIAPQVFSFDSDGVITGHLNPGVVAAARANGIKLVPLVMNPGFNQKLIHRILNVAAVRRRAIHSLTALCRTDRLDGIQFDLENVNVVDRNALTAFARESADSLHRAGCTLSAAVVPRASDEAGPSAFHAWMFANWRGVYDYKALADALDFLSYMTYAQHTGGTTPGPVAGYPWVEDDVKYLLSLGVPASKVSLGLATYSDYWYPTYDEKKGEHAAGRDVSYQEAMSILTKRNLKSSWDSVQKASFAMWDEAGVMEYLWIEDARAFQAKVALVAKYHLRGYSAWVIGLEDPRIWDGLSPVAR